MKYKYIDLFAGCGGLSDGFHKTPDYDFVAAVEWEKEPARNLINRLQTKWGEKSAADKVMRFDIQRTEDLFGGWTADEDYGSHQGLDSLVGDKSIDLIIGVRHAKLIH